MPPRNKPTTEAQKTPISVLKSTASSSRKRNQVSIADSESADSTPARAAKRTRQSHVAAQASADHAFQQQDQDEVEEDEEVVARSSRKKAAPSRTPQKQAKRADSPKDDDDGPDTLRVLDFIGTSMENRNRKTNSSLNKQRAYNLYALWGLYEPPDLAIVPAGQTAEFNHDEPEQGDGSSTSTGLCWLHDGLARTRLLKDGFAALKRERSRIWTTVPGLVPPYVINDMAWWPGKGYGYREAIQRSSWAEEQRAKKEYAEEKVGWPFVHPGLDCKGVKVLSKSEAKVYAHKPAEEQEAFRHPMHISGSGIPRPIPPTTPRKKGAAVADDDDGPSSENDEDDEPASSNNLEADLSDAAFNGIPNLGLAEHSVSSETIIFNLGPHGSQTPVSLARGASLRHPNLAGSHILNAGGHIYDLDWCPVPIHLNRGKEYLAISSSLTSSPRTKLGDHLPRPTPGSIQIWSVSLRGEAMHEMNLCIESGSAYKLAWCPVGHDYREKSERLGILAAVCADGSVNIFSVPVPKGKDFKLEPVVRLEVKSAAICLDWAGGELLAAGCANGYLAVWNVGQALRTLSSQRPTHYFAVHTTSFTSLSFLLQPPLTSSGAFALRSLPYLIFSSSLSGNVVLTDLRSTLSGVSEHHRSAAYTTAWHPYSSVLLNESGFSATMYSVRPDELARTRGLGAANARITDMATSAFHPIAALATAGGEVKLCNAMRANRRSGVGKGQVTRLQTPLFRVTADRKTGALSMLDNLLAEVS